MKILNLHSLILSFAMALSFIACDDSTANNNNNNTTCSPQYEKFCQDNNVYERNNCDDVKTLEETCGEDKYCTAGSCEDKISESPICENGDYYNQITNNETGDATTTLIQECDDINEYCNPENGCQECGPSDNKVCLNGDSYNTNACNNIISINQVCDETQKCDEPTGGCVCDAGVVVNKTCSLGASIIEDGCGGETTVDCSDSEYCNKTTGECVENACTPDAGNICIGDKSYIVNSCNDANQDGIQTMAEDCSLLDTYGTCDNPTGLCVVGAYDCENSWDTSCTDTNGDGKGDLTWMAYFQGSMNWTDADQACQNSHLLGHSDWRLPTFEEALGMISGCDALLQCDPDNYNLNDCHPVSCLGGFGPGLNGFFTDSTNPLNVPAGSFFTSHEVAGQPNIIITINYLDAIVNQESKTDISSFYCVRDNN